MASSAIASTSAPLASSARWTDRRRRRPRDESLRRTPRSIARASASASEPPPPPAAGAAGAKQRVVITGSTKGLGLALARAFLSRGDGVFITSRDAENVRATVADLRSRFGDAAVVHGHPSNVGDASSVAALADEVVKVFGGVDLWINNAGSNGYRYENLDDADPATIAEVVTTNSLGSILCTRQAIITMKRHNDERSPGHIFNMEGAGSDGGATKKYAAYGHTKAGMAQLAKTMREELKGENVAVHTISPGMVFTELISSGRYAFGGQGRMFVNALAEDADDTAAVIVERVKEAIAAADAVEKTIAVKVLTPDVALKKMFNRFVRGVNKDRWYPEKDERDA